MRKKKSGFGFGRILRPNPRKKSKDGRIKRKGSTETLTLICNPIPNRVNPKRRRGRGKKGKRPIRMNFDELRKEKKSKKGEERERGGLPRRHATSQSRRRVGKRKAGRGSARRDPAIGAPWPGHSTAARSPAGERARRRGGQRRRWDLAASPWSLGDELRGEGESSEAKRESVRMEMEVRVSVDRRWSRFFIPPRHVLCRWILLPLRSTARKDRASFGSGGHCCSAEIPAQA